MKWPFGIFDKASLDGRGDASIKEYDVTVEVAVLSTGKD